MASMHQFSIPIMYAIRPVFLSMRQKPRRIAQVVFHRDCILLIPGGEQHDILPEDIREQCTFGAQSQVFQRQITYIMH